MKFAEKIVMLRKSGGMSQEDLAEKLNVSRQSVSRWELGTAMPDAANLLQLSKLFNVTVDYLLNDDYQSDNDLPKIKEHHRNNTNQIMLYLILLEVLVVCVQFMSVFILKNIVFGVLSILLFTAIICGFEYAYRKNGNKTSDAFRARFYKISAWFGTYFPMRLILLVLTELVSFDLSRISFEFITFVLYIAASMLIMLSIDKQNIR